MPRTPATPELKARGERLAVALRLAREDRELAQELLARRADVSVETVRKIEARATSNPGFFTVAALAEALGISLDDLAARSAS